MKKNQFLTFILATTLWTIGAEAQPSYYNAIVKLDNTTNDKVLVCDYLSRYIITYSHRSNTTGIEHFFTVQDMMTGITKQFPLDPFYPPALSTSPTTYIVNDIKVGINGTCWFCGKKTVQNGAIYYIGIGWLPTYVDYGIVGCFSISEVLNGSGSYNFFSITNTEDLTRIEPRGNYEQIFMIGKPKGLPNVSCLVGLGYNYTFSDWRYDIVPPSDTNEIFTDVADAGVGVVVVSRFKNDHYAIGLRHAKNGPIFDLPYIGQLSNCNIYDMQNVIEPISGQAVAWRKDSDPILLASGESSSGIVLAHACDQNAYGIAAYNAYINDLGDARISQILYTKASSYVKLLDCMALSGTSNTCFLIDNNYDNHSEQYTVNWQTPSTIFYVKYFCNKSDYTWQGLASFGSNPGYRYIIGFNSYDNPVYTAYKTPFPSGINCIFTAYSRTALLITPTFNTNATTLVPYSSQIVCNPLAGTFTCSTPSLINECITY